MTSIVVALMERSAPNWSSSAFVMSLQIFLLSSAEGINVILKCRHVFTVNKGLSERRPITKPWHSVRIWGRPQRGGICQLHLVPREYSEHAVPSNPLVSNARPDSFDGVGVNGHSQSQNVLPIPCLIFESMPMS